MSWESWQRREAARRVQFAMNLSNWRTSATAHCQQLSHVTRTGRRESRDKNARDAKTMLPRCDPRPSPARMAALSL
jgi:hypothetical protein